MTSNATSAKRASRFFRFKKTEVEIMELAANSTEQLLRGTTENVARLRQLVYVLETAPMDVKIDAYHEHYKQWKRYEARRKVANVEFEKTCPKEGPEVVGYEMRRNAIFESDRMLREVMADMDRVLKDVPEYEPFIEPPVQAKSRTCMRCVVQ